MSYVFPVGQGLLTAVLFLGVSAFVTYWVCRKEVALKPVDSMRPEPPSARLKQKKGEAKKKPSVFGLSFFMAMRNIRLDRRKSVMVVLGVLGCTALLCCGYGIEDTVWQGIDHDMSLYHHADITATFADAEPFSREEEIGALQGVASCEAYKISVSSFHVENGAEVTKQIYLISEGSSFYANAWTFGVEQVGISKKMAEKTGANVGDTLHFDVDGEDYEAPIGQIYDAFFFQGIAAHEEASFFEGHAFQASGCYIDVKEGASQAEVKKEVASLSYVASVQTKEEWADYIEDVLSGVLVMTNAVKVFAILLAIVVLYNLALMNFSERTRDIATLKVLGFTRFEIALSLMSETMVLTALGVALGLAAGYPFLLAVMGTNIVELVQYMYFIKPVSYLISFLLTFVVAFVVNALLVLRTNKVKMVESLKSVE